ncbi:hypothetical protein E2C01_096241 [Portunus trituberculatus]|uniref:Uncharacterized protein n=1 Tax=Portunus trituberculatus TaxID=210409 RepID=A0A5B7K1I2_PORTR|nr:hypothetical protein [Portunus trituberculatus]
MQSAFLLVLFFLILSLCSPLFSLHSLLLLSALHLQILGGNGEEEKEKENETEKEEKEKEKEKEKKKEKEKEKEDTYLHAN